MGIKERKRREKEEFKALVLEKAYEIIKEGGLDALSMRKLAGSIEYSASKLYQFFENKDMIIWALCDDICKRLHDKLNDVPQYRDKEKYLMALTRSNIDFHANEPVSIEVLNYICFGPQGIKPPQSYSKAVNFYSKAVRELKYPSLQTEEQIESALDIIRVIFVGLTHIMQTETSGKGYKKMVKLMESSMKVLITGWRETENKE